jgi:hypothetical protein
MEKNTNVIEFEEKRYTTVRNALPLEIVELATQYALFDEMQDFTADVGQVIGAHSKYADPFMESLLIKLLPTMEAATGLSLSPTYSFYRVYRNGDVLTPHKDRPACEISCTVSFNYSYEESDYSWPIYMDGQAIHLKPGDLAVYKGIENEHWRDPLTFPEPAWHVQAFLHYVDKNGPYAEHKFDKRESVGVLPKGVKEEGKNKSYISFTG